MGGLFALQPKKEGGMFGGLFGDKKPKNEFEDVEDAVEGLCVYTHTSHSMLTHAHIHIHKHTHTYAHTHNTNTHTNTHTH